MILLLITVKMNQKSSKSDENQMRYDQNHKNHIRIGVLHGFDHISLSFHLICLIVGSFSVQLVGKLQVIIIGLNQLHPKQI